MGICNRNHANAGSESLFGASISKRHGILYTEALVDLNMLHVTWENENNGHVLQSKYLHVDTTYIC